MPRPCLTHAQQRNPEHTPTGARAKPPQSKLPNHLGPKAWGLLSSRGWGDSSKPQQVMGCRGLLIPLQSPEPFGQGATGCGCGVPECQHCPRTSHSLCPTSALPVRGASGAALPGNCYLSSFFGLLSVLHVLGCVTVPVCGKELGGHRDPPTGTGTSCCHPRAGHRVALTRRHHLLPPGLPRRPTGTPPPPGPAQVPPMSPCSKTCQV